MYGSIDARNSQISRLSIATDAPAQGLAYQDPQAVKQAAALGVVTPQAPVLHQICQRLENIACRLTDANFQTRFFVERVSGAQEKMLHSTKNQGLPQNKDKGPAIKEILDILIFLECALTDTEFYSNELGRIG